VCVCVCAWYERHTTLCEGKCVLVLVLVGGVARVVVLCEVERCILQ
jgi:hypothetical protein